MIAAPDCMQRGHAVQCASPTLNVFARQWQSGWCLKPIYGMLIATLGPIVFGSGTALILESSRIACQRQWCLEKDIFELEKHSKVSSSSARRVHTFAIPGGEKSIEKALLQVGFLSYLDSLTNSTRPPFTSLYGELRVTDRLTDWLTGTLTNVRDYISFRK